MTSDLGKQKLMVQNFFLPNFEKISIYLIIGAGSDGRVGHTKLVR